MKPEHDELLSKFALSCNLRHYSLVASVGKSSLFVGGPGTAKTTTIKSFMDSFDPEVMASKSITFSSLTTPNIFQFTVEASVEKRQGRTFGPPGGKKLLVGRCRLTSG